MGKPIRNGSNVGLGDAIVQFLNAADELRWRIFGLPNHTHEFLDGSCKHSPEYGCSWRCERMLVDGPLTLDEIRETVHAALGAPLFELLDSPGDNVRDIEAKVVRA